MSQHTREIVRAVARRFGIARAVRLARNFGISTPADYLQIIGV